MAVKLRSNLQSQASVLPLRSCIIRIGLLILLVFTSSVSSTNESTEFSDGNHALRNLESSSPTSTTSLCLLYSSSGGATWTNNTGWKDGCASQTNATSNICQWYGVSCDMQSGSVIGLDLSFNGLLGNVTFEDVSTQLQPIASTLKILSLGSNYGYWMAFPRSTDSSANSWDLSAVFPHLEVLDFHWIVNDGVLPSQFPSALRYLELSSRWTLRREFFRSHGSVSEPARPTDSRTGVGGVITSQMLQALSSSLEHLGLSGARVTYEASVTLSSFCLSRLIYLDLFWQPLDSFVQGQEGVSTCFNKSLSTLLLPRRVAALNISEMVEIVGEYYPNLRELGLSATDVSSSSFPKVGEFPASLPTWLPKLEFLVLTHLITGGTQLPSSWSVLPLWFLSLRDTQIAGQVPPEWSAFIKCESFDISNSYLEATGTNDDQGALSPQLFTNWTNLYYLRLDPATDRSSLLTIGSMPSLADSTTLRTLYISDCRGTTTGGWTGILPEGIANMSILEIVHMGCSGLSGSMSVFAGLTKIRHLYLTSVPLRGPIPSNTSWPVMEELLLSGCGINGLLPPGVLQSSALALVRIDSNQLEGDGAPWELLQAKGMTLFDASSNRFTDAGLLSSTKPLPLGSIFPLLTTFSLRTNLLNVSAAYLRVFFAAPQLSILDLGQNRITMFLNDVPIFSFLCARSVTVNSSLSIIRLDNNAIGQGFVLPSPLNVSFSTVTAVALLGSCLANMPHLTQVRMQNNGMWVCNRLPDWILDVLAQKLPAFTLCERHSNTTSISTNDEINSQSTITSFDLQRNVTWMEPLQLMLHCLSAVHSLNESSTIDDLKSSTLWTAHAESATRTAWHSCAMNYAYHPSFEVSRTISSMRGSLLKDEPVRFPSLVSADVSGNPLAIVFPNFTFPTGSLSARLLQLLDFHNMDMRGQVSTMFSFVPGLKFDQNPRLRSLVRDPNTGRLLLPPFAQATNTTLLRLDAQQLLCPSFNRSDGGDIIALDAAYLAFEGCWCEAGMVWIPAAQTCVACPPQIVCDTAVFRPIHSIRPGYYPLFPDCGLDSSDSMIVRWQIDTIGCSAEQPSPSTLKFMQSDVLLNATIVPCWGGLTACPDAITFTTGSNATAPSSSTVGGFDGNATASSSLFTCADGHDSGSFLCSACLPGYYPFSNDCIECPKGESLFVGATMVVGSIAIIVFCFLQAGSSSDATQVTSGKPNRRNDFRLGTVIQCVLLWQQSLGVLTTVGIRPPTHLWRDTLTSISNFSPIAIECIDTRLDARAQFLIMAGTFAGLSVVAIGSALLSVFRPSNAQSPSITRILRSSLLLLLFMYVPLFQRALQQLRFSSINVLSPPDYSAINNPTESSSSGSNNGDQAISELVLWSNYRSTMIQLFHLTWIPYQSGGPTELHTLFSGWTMPVAALITCTLVVVPLCMSMLFACSQQYKLREAGTGIDSSRSINAVTVLRPVLSSVYPSEFNLNSKHSGSFSHHSLASPLLHSESTGVGAPLGVAHAEDSADLSKPSDSTLRSLLCCFRDLPEDDGDADNQFSSSSSSVWSVELNIASSLSKPPSLSESVVGFLSQSCRPNHWWYSVVYVPLFRKLTFVSAAVLFPRTALLVLLLLFAVLFVAFALQLHVRPFRTVVDNMVELILLAHLLVTFQLEVVATALQSAQSYVDSSGNGGSNVVGGLSGIDVDASSSSLNAARTVLLYVQDAILAVVTICVINEVAFQLRVLYHKPCRKPSICGNSCCRRDNIHASESMASI